MYVFHITGFLACRDPYYYDSNNPVNITVRAENQKEAIVKAEKVLGNKIHPTHREIVIREDVVPKSEVAREIFEEIDKTVFADMDFFKELKKKYTEGKE